MKKIILLAGILLSMVAASFAQASTEGDLVGVWLTEDKDLKVEFFKTGNTYSGKLLWAKSMFEADGKTPKKDDKNPDEKLRSRSRQGIVNITGLTYAGGEYENGKLYNPQNGSTYIFTAKLTGIDKLEGRGYMGLSLLGKTIKWTRVR